MPESTAHVHVATAADENYVIPLTAMMRSAEFNFRGQRLTFHLLLDKNIAAWRRERVLSELRGNTRVAVHCLDVDAVDVPGVSISGHVSIATYFRLLLPDLLENLDKVVYLDSDLVVNADLSALWEKDLQGLPIMAVQEQWHKSQTISSPLTRLDLGLAGARPSAKYFNAGVLVMDLEAMRKERFVEKALAFVQRHPEKLMWHDQDVLNYIFAGRWAELDLRWNVLTQLFWNRGWKDSPVSGPEDYRRLMDEPFIVHFNTEWKPWSPESNHPLNYLFHFYLGKTSWLPHEIQPWIRRNVEARKRNLIRAGWYPIFRQLERQLRRRWLTRAKQFR